MVRLGEAEIPAGRAGEAPSVALSASLRELGLELQRFKTGTVPRVLKSSLHLDELPVQPSDRRPRRFHHSPVTRPERELLPCWVTHTTEATHELLRRNFHQSALVSGKIEGTGPRYCPSIEAKLLRFPGRTSHTAFLEQEGWDTEEIYVQGVSNSLPPAVQLEMLHSMPGLGEAVMLRPGYAIEYDCLDARQLDRFLRYPKVEGLFLAGQVNGTSGYEEAAAQGLLAGINAACWLRQEEMLSLTRSEAYLGVMVDDLVSKGTEEPYRMLTARAEHRLLLGTNSALRRLGGYGAALGLLPEQVRKEAEREEELLRQEMERLYSIPLTQGNIRKLPEGLESGRAMRSVAEVLQQERTTYAAVARAFPPPRSLPVALHEELTARLRYEPYWREESERAALAHNWGQVSLPGDLDYSSLPLRQEAQEALSRARPGTLEQAAALPGVTPADVTVLRSRLR
jgi:tRNA uridine 5-carboxymethylaminomethyl modification enzyme